MSDDLCHSAFRFMLFIAIVCQLHYYFMPGHSPFRMFFTDKNICRNLLIIRDHKSKCL